MSPTGPAPSPGGRGPSEPLDGMQRLWAPWRSAYLEGADPIEGCPFCVIPARDRTEDERSLLLHRGEHSFVVLNSYPYNPGHLMVVPYAHEADLEALDVEVASEIWELGRRTVVLLKERLRAEGVNLGMNLGQAGGAGIADHLHLHAVPRWIGDTNFIATVGAARVLPQALADVHAALTDGFTAT